MQISEDETPLTLVAKEHWRQRGVWPDGWPAAKVREVAALYGCTVMELGAACAIKFGLMRQCERNGKYPPHLAAHFAFMEDLHQAALVKLPPRKPTYPVGEMIEENHNEHSNLNEY